MGPRRIGKTILIKQLIAQLEEPHILLNGEDVSTVEVLTRRSTQHFRNILGEKKILLIDEAQKIPDIGRILKTNGG